nr:hypothetical protein Q903MT_gene606 [Picea sitchensis]
MRFLSFFLSLHHSGSFPDANMDDYTSRRWMMEMDDGWREVRLHLKVNLKVSTSLQGDG